MDKIEITCANDWYKWNDKEQGWEDAPAGAKQWVEDNPIQLFYMIQIEEAKPAILQEFINATDREQYAHDYIFNTWLWDKREQWLRIKIEVARILRQEAQLEISGVKV